MRIFVAGASGVIGVRLLPLLAAAGHDLMGLTRTPEKARRLRDLGAEPAICDVYDAPRLAELVLAFGADMILHQLTDLPDDETRIAERSGANARIRQEGTRNLLAAGHAAGVERFLAQSIAWPLTGVGAVAVDYLENAVLKAGGVVFRYGRFYGPGTYHETELPPQPRIDLDEAARRTVLGLNAPSGVITIVDEP